MRPYSDDELRAAVDAYRACGTYRAAGLKLGKHYTRVLAMVHRAAQCGLMGYDPVLPGYAVRSISTRTNARGSVIGQTIQQAREPGPAFAVPRGHAVKGVSALLNADGQELVKWVKTDKARVDPLALAREIRAAFADWTPCYVPPAPPDAGIDEQLALYPISDLHIGMLAYGRETGEDWDLRIAERVILETYAQLVAMTPATAESVILFGGDQQHADNFDGVTERGKHILSVDSRYPKVYLTLCRIAVEIVMLARHRHGRVLVRVLQGNHDRHSAIALAYFLHAYFRNDDFVSVDLDPSLFWFHSYGANLICGVHGHTIKAPAVAGKIAAIRARQWGESTFRVCHFFHEHHDEVVVKDHDGMQVVKHAIIAPPDAYAAGAQYAASRNAKSYIYHKTRGELGRSIVNIIPAHEVSA